MKVLSVRFEKPLKVGRRGRSTSQIKQGEAEMSLRADLGVLIVNGEAVPLTRVDSMVLGPEEPSEQPKVKSRG